MDLMNSLICMEDVDLCLRAKVLEFIHILYLQLECIIKFLHLWEVNLVKIKLSES